MFLVTKLNVNDFGAKNSLRFKRDHVRNNRTRYKRDPVYLLQSTWICMSDIKLFNYNDSTLNGHVYQDQAIISRSY